MIKQVIRMNTFETNSSSAHSLVYCKNASSNYSDYLQTNEDGALVIHFRTYGWYGPDEVGDLLKTANDKLDYIMSYFCQDILWDSDFYNKSRQELEEELEDDPDLIKDIISEIGEIQELIDYILEQNPDITDVTYELDGSGVDCFGYVEGGSHIIEGKSTEELYSEIICNKNCLIVIDNDEEYRYVFFREDCPSGEFVENSPFGRKRKRYNITEKDFQR